MFWVLGEGNSLGNPLVSFSFTSSLCIPNYELKETSLFPLVYAE